MPDERWRGREVPAAAALLLLPVVPPAVRILSGQDRWGEGLSAWGIRQDDAADIALAQSAEAAAACGCSTLLLDGRDDAGVLASVGYATTTWSAISTSAGATALIRRRGPRPARPPRWQPLLRSLAVEAIHRSRGASEVTVASKHPGPPALLAEAGFGASAYLLAGGGGSRRRPVFITGTEGAEPSVALKVTRADDAARAAHEQEVLRQVRAAGTSAASPRPLGAGLVSGLAWSAESAMGGLPLADVLAHGPSTRRLRDLLTSLTRWFADLAVATALHRDWDAPGDVPLALRGRHADLATLHVDLSGVPAVLMHADVGSAFNVHVQGNQWSVIDWETAQLGGLPLIDVFLLLTGALAAVSGAQNAQAQGAYVLQLCAGEAPDSDWFLACIGDYLHRAGVPLRAAGALAALALGYQASMPLVHAEMVRAAGAKSSTWPSLWDHASGGWTASPLLGARWTALRERLVA